MMDFDGIADALFLRQKQLNDYKYALCMGDFEFCKGEKNMNIINCADVKIVIGDDVFVPNSVSVEHDSRFQTAILNINVTVENPRNPIMTKRNKPVVKNPEKLYCSPEIKKVIFNDPATIVLWADGTKTVVKAKDELFDPEKGLAMAMCKKVLGNKGNYFDTFKKFVFENDTIKVLWY